MFVKVLKALETKRAVTNFNRGFLKRNRGIEIMEVLNEAG
jgi:hypothetical protein